MLGERQVAGVTLHHLSHQLLPSAGCKHERDGGQELLSAGDALLFITVPSRSGSVSSLPPPELRRCFIIGDNGTLREPDLHLQE